ncbi:MAG: LTA synthase family protein, partial [Bdellovibrio sp.]
DVEFINFVGRRFSYDGLFILNEISGKTWNFVSSYWPLFLLNGLLLVAFFFSVKKIFHKTEHLLPRRWWGERKAGSLVCEHIAMCVVAVAIAVLGIRGGLQSKPVNFVNANVFPAPLLNNLVLNSTFTFIKSYGAQGLRQEKYFDDKNEMLSLLNGHLSGSLLQGKRPTARQNVVLIVLESFGEEYVGPNEQGHSYTPFLDSLMRKSVVFTNAYANGRRSIEGIGAIMAGIPALMSEPFISSHFTSNYFVGLGTLVAEQGYATSFFHGGHNGTMYFDSFMQSAGVEKYFGAREYGNAADDDGVWGIWDEPFLQWMLAQLDQVKPPFLTSVFTLTSHQPYKIPAQYADKFPEGPLPILKAVSYTDYALQRFFAEAAKKPWFDQTLFIITADHTAQSYRSDFNNEVGSYRIPLILYHPRFAFPKVDTTLIAQQIDILPTVLDFLGIEQKDKNYLGSSLFTPGDKAAVVFNDGRYWLFAQDSFVRWAPGQQDPQMFSLEDRQGRQEVQTDEPRLRKQELVRKLKATIQYFNEGMWDNKLYYPQTL